MKKTIYHLLIFFIMLLCISQFVSAQTKKTSGDIDSLNIYSELQIKYSEFNIDSSLYFGDKALAFAAKLNQPYYEALLQAFQAFTYISKQEYIKSINLLNDALKKANNKKIANNIIETPFIKKYIIPNDNVTNIAQLKGYIKNMLAGLYGANRDYKRELEELFSAAAYADNKAQDYFLLSGIYSNIANAYFRNGLYDSALYYQRKTLAYEKKMDSYTYAGASLTMIGDIFKQKLRYDSAKIYYHEGLQQMIKQGDNITFISLTYASLAEIYSAELQKDSSLYYARKAYNSFLLLGDDVAGISSPAQALAAAFALRKQYDSAYHYLQISQTKFSEQSEKEITNLNNFQKQNFEEQLTMQEAEAAREKIRNRNRIYALMGGLLLFLVIAYILYRNNRAKQKANKLLEETLTNLKLAQNHLIQAEKMASLGELTSGIAHEIQNPLNFVNNFSEVSSELIDEMITEINKNDLEEAKVIANDIKHNLEKINHHGKRADAIVKGMLQHSRSSNNTKEPSNINALADEYLRLAYHGLRAKDKSFNATMKTDFDETIGKINIIPQDMGRVILNLITNAFYAVNERQKAESEVPNAGSKAYEPTVVVSTKKMDDKVEIKVKDNGNGIPQRVMDKIFQPFFTTKPTGEGTGLGLSISYDIVKTHGGILTVKTTEGEGTEFTISLPQTN